MGLELEAAQHVGDLAAELARVQRVAPELAQRRARQRQRLVLAQHAGNLGLAAGHQHHVARVARQAEGDRVVGRGVAGVQRGHDIDLGRDLVRGHRLLHRGRDKAHAIEAQPSGQLAGALDQLGAGLDAVDPADLALGEEQVVEHEAQIRLAGAMVDQADVAARRQRLLQQRLDELQQVIDLLELAPRVLVQLALARQDMQLLEQLDRLAGAQFGQLFLDGFFGRALGPGRLALLVRLDGG